MNARYLLTLPFILSFFLLPALVSGQVNKLKSEKLVIGLIPEKNKTDQLRRYRHIAYYLSGKLGMEVRLVYVPYDDLVDSLRKNRVNAAFFGSFGYIKCRKAVGVSPVARPVWPNDNSTYSGYIFVRNDSEIKNVEDMKDKVLVMVSRSTTAGYLFPKKYFSQHGVSHLDEYFSKVLYAGSHEDAAWAVFSGEAQVGAAKNHIFNELKLNNPAFAREMHILAESCKVPSNVLAVSQRISKETQLKMRVILESMHKDKKGKKILQIFGASKFITTENEDYKNCYKMAAEANIDY